MHGTDRLRADSEHGAPAPAEAQGGSAMSAVLKRLRHPWRTVSLGAVRPRGVKGPIAVLAAVVSLSGVDQGTLPVNAGALERAFGVGHTGIGLLASVTTLTGALFILPMGALTDRVNRTRLLAGGVALWAAASVLSGLAPSFAWLLAARVGLAAVTAVAGPTIASLLGD